MRTQAQIKKILRLDRIRAKRNSMPVKRFFAAVDGLRIYAAMPSGEVIRCNALNF